MSAHSSGFVDVKQDLYDIIPGDGTGVILCGETVRNDSPYRAYQYSSGSALTPDGEAIIQPTLVTGNGRWIKGPMQQIQADWNETTTTDPSYINNKPTLAAVATSGAYSDLSGTPSIPAAQVQSDWNQASGGAVDFIKNKPTLATVSATGAYSDLLGKPTLATVATTGVYSDLTGKPSIPAAQVQADWTEASSGAVDFIKNKPTLSTVASTGAYSDLSGKPSLATVATTGAYADLTGKPSIPAAQIQSDWTQASSGSVDFIKNKPTLATVATTGAYSDLSGKPSLATVATTGSYTDLINKPTRTINNSVSRSIVTGTGAVGFQVSSTQDSRVQYSIQIDTTVSLSGNQKGHVVVEIAPTNSATAGDWVEVSRVASGQSGTLVIGLTLNQTGGGMIGGAVPAGYYVKIRSINDTGTPTYTYNSGQEELMP